MSYMVMLFHDGIPIEDVLDRLFTASVKPEIAIVSEIGNQTRIFMSFPGNCIVGNGLFRDWLSVRLDRHVFVKDGEHFVEMSSDSPLRSLRQPQPHQYKLGSS